MKKAIILLLISFIAIDSFSQEGTTARERYVKMQIELRDSFVEKVSDSLNLINIQESKEIPYFFTEPDYDRKFANNKIEPNSKYSVRKLILDRIFNISLLYLVVDETKDSTVVKIKEVPKGNYYISRPFEDVSTLDLVKNRIWQLQNLLATGKLIIDEETGLLISPD